MSTVLHPVGPQRARVYWVRRLLVVVLLVVLAAVGWAVVSRVLGRGGDPAAASAAEQPAGSADADATSGQGADEPTDGADGTAGADGADGAGDGEKAVAAPTTPVDCTPDALQVTLTASGQIFDAATRPVLTATITNVGDVPCTVDAGDANREVLITSGADRIWSSKDCATEETASRQLLLGSGAADSVELTWDRTRTAEGCPAGLPEPRSGTYQAVTTLGTVSSVPVVFALQ
jgi:hypothetical protein